MRRAVLSVVIVAFIPGADACSFGYDDGGTLASAGPLVAFARGDDIVALDLDNAEEEFLLARDLPDLHDSPAGTAIVLEAQQGVGAECEGRQTVTLFGADGTLRAEWNGTDAAVAGTHLVYRPEGEARLHRGDLVNMSFTPLDVPPAEQPWWTTVAASDHHVLVAHGFNGTWNMYGVHGEAVATNMSVDGRLVNPAVFSPDGTRVALIYESGRKTVVEAWSVPAMERLGVWRLAQESGHGWGNAAWLDDVLLATGPGAVWMIDTVGGTRQGWTMMDAVANGLATHGEGAVLSWQDEDSSIVGISVLDAHGSPIGWYAHAGDGQWNRAPHPSLHAMMTETTVSGTQDHDAPGLLATALLGALVVAIAVRIRNR